MHKRLFYSAFNYCFSLFLLLLLIIGGLIYWAFGSSLPKHSKLDLDEVEHGELPKVTDTIIVTSYNIGHGQGVKENAWDHRDKKTTLKQLGMLSEAIAKMDADILLLQEVDLDSNRTYHIDQIRYLKEKADYPYHACAMVWKKNYVPYPYWPPAHHIGYVRAANCVLSKYPLSNHERTIFDKPASNPFWYNWAYIDRGIQRVDVQIDQTKKVAVLNVHLEAWDMKTREQQAMVLGEYMKEIDLPIILGGDFNTVPLSSDKKNKFIDEPETDYSDEKTFPWLFNIVKDLKKPRLVAKINDPFSLYTFPSDMPNRRLDHIFLIGNSLAFMNFWVEKSAALASDHLPVVAKIRVSK